MQDKRPKVRIAVNVMRARLTILGFNAAIITFQFDEIRVLQGGVALPGIDFPVHITAATSLFIGLALSMLAIASFLASAATDETATCDHWCYLLGDLLMYLALAQTVAGFFGPFLLTLGEVNLTQVDEARTFRDVRTVVAILGGTVWFAVQYVSPLVSLVRSPFNRRTTLALAGVYVLLLLLISWVVTTAWRLQAGRLGLDDPGPPWLGGLVAPLYW